MNTHKGIKYVLLAGVLVWIAIISNMSSVEAFDPVKHYSDIEKTKQGIETYKASNNAMISTISKKNLDDLHCTITFNQAISVSNLKSLCEKYGLKLKVVETRQLVNGIRYTSATIFDGNFENLEAEINEINANVGGTFKGVIDVYALLDSEQIGNIQNDRNVYLCDVSGDAASIGYYKKDGVERNRERFDNGLNDFPHALSWDLETLK